jgi:S-adenosylmethionine-diacylglycerol 3-amino-3-carboxypropyl transferase
MANLAPVASRDDVIHGDRPSVGDHRVPGRHRSRGLPADTMRIQPGETVLTIGAAGDNVLGLLLDEPARILAVDVSPAQCALVELKIAAARFLQPTEVRPFLCAGDPNLQVYERLRPALPSSSRRYWDAHGVAIARGAVHCGRFERYLALFRRWLLQLVPGRAAVQSMLSARTLAEQQRIYATQWDSIWWRSLFRLFFHRQVIAALGRDPAYFALCEVDNVADHYLRRAQTALTTIPLRENPYLAYMLSGDYDTADRTPCYLKTEHLERIPPFLDRIEVRESSLRQALDDLPSHSIDAFYLSDVFELASTAEYESALAEIVRVARPGARLCYWNNLVRRQRPASLANVLQPHEQLADLLHQQDRSFLYSRFVVESVVRRS